MRTSKIIAAVAAVALASTATGALAGSSARGRRIGSAKLSPNLLGQTSDVHAKQSPDDALTRALRAGRLSRGEYALQRARSLFHLNQVRSEFGIVSRPGPRDATMILRDLALAYRSLSGEERGQAGAILARPTDGASDPAEDGYQAGVTVSRHCSTNFCFHWVSQTSDAVSPTDANGNSLPDYIDSAVTTFEHVRTVETGPPLGFRPPKPDQTSANNGGDSKTDIYFTDTGDEGVYGYCTSDDPALDNPSSRFDVSAYCTLDNDFNTEQFTEPGSSGLEALQVTAAHEYFHAIQYAYDIGEDKWLLEGSATWMEDVVYDDINDYLQYLPVSQMGLPTIPLDFSSTGDGVIAQSKYGAFLFFRFLSDAVLGTIQSPDNSFMRQVFEHADSSHGGANDEHSVQAVESVLDERGKSFTDVYALFGVANLFPTTFYAEGAAYAENADLTGQVVTISSANSPKTVQSKTVDHLTHSYKLFRPGSGVRSSSRLKLAFNGPPVANGTAGTLVVLASSGPTSRRFALNSAGDATVKAAFGKGTVTAVVVIMTNASRTYDCFRRQPFSCQGVPQHENQVFKVKATLLR